MFSDEPYLQSVFGLTVTPSVSMRKELLNHMKIHAYYRYDFDTLFPLRMQDSKF
ncbi:hypothetical protein AGR4C_Cc180093 [Agrobacterium tumefaciens str. Kerr 14]|uniref:Uncharacterized protein n=1 Tax=Agrobacterium tumefaciens str. Kerr 14 TaxID=1183424 RepID=A0A1S7PIL2_AGRTU|nr:hypothetical protein AGR4C_Cc180093 [Agrobacterium tumefaciens str. Kerr 14]